MLQPVHTVVLSEELAVASLLLGQPNREHKAEFSLPLPSKKATRAHVSATHLLIFLDLNISVISIPLLTLIELVK